MIATQTTTRARPSTVSIVVPLYNEQDNVAPLLAGVESSLAQLAHPWEILLVNDGSSDRTEQVVAVERSQRGPHIRLLSLQRHFGQTAAMQAGIDAARGDIIVTLDGDLQNDPADIPDMIRRLLAEDLDLVVGWRRKRQDNLWLRRLPSLLANDLIGRVTGIRLHDYGCSLKVFRAAVVRSVRLYGDMHRFIPAWLSLYTAHDRIAEHVVRHHPRRFGRSKYGLGRAQRVGLDLLSVYFFSRFCSNPAHFFGRIGLFFGFLATGLSTYLAWIKLVAHEGIANRPLLEATILCVMISVQFLSIGILSEFLSRTYYESSRTRPYTVRHLDPPPDLGPGRTNPASALVLH